jgi:hypothetical protein
MTTRHATEPVSRPGRVCLPVTREAGSTRQLRLRESPGPQTPKCLPARTTQITPAMVASRAALTADATMRFRGAVKRALCDAVQLWPDQVDIHAARRDSVSGIIRRQIAFHASRQKK